MLWGRCTAVSQGKGGIPGAIVQEARITALLQYSIALPMTQRKSPSFGRASHLVKVVRDCSGCEARSQHQTRPALVEKVRDTHLAGSLAQRTECASRLRQILDATGEKAQASSSKVALE
jgi:hypothetical protein